MLGSVVKEGSVLCCFVSRGALSIVMLQAVRFTLVGAASLLTVTIVVTSDSYVRTTVLSGCVLAVCGTVFTMHSVVSYGLGIL